MGGWVHCKGCLDMGSLLLMVPCYWQGWSWPPGQHSWRQRQLQWAQVGGIATTRCLGVGNLLWIWRTGRSWRRRPLGWCRWERVGSLPDAVDGTVRLWAAGRAAGG